jgi:hypothetical protein
MPGTVNADMGRCVAEGMGQRMKAALGGFQLDWCRLS